MTAPDAETSETVQPRSGSPLLKIFAAFTGLGALGTALVGGAALIVVVLVVLFILFAESSPVLPFIYTVI